jgi:hypothetical protein
MGIDPLVHRIVDCRGAVVDVVVGDVAPQLLDGSLMRIGLGAVLLR